MKVDIVLLIIAIILAFLTGNITYFIKSEQKVSINDIKELNDINNELQINYSPLLRLDLNIDYPTHNHLELLNPIKTIKKNINFLTPRKIDCLKNKFAQISSDFLDKEILWTSFLCKQIILFPKDYFKSPPYIHSNGLSYAYMYYKYLESNSKKGNWYQRFAKYMHINELKSINWPLDESSQFMISLPPNIIARITQNEKVILSKHSYMLRTGNLKYFVINRNKAQRYFSRVGYVLTSDMNNCFIKIGNVCWKKKPHNIITFLSQSTVIIFGITLFIFILTANAIYRRIKLKNFEEDKKKHALRVLTHELRTPVSSLLLEMEDLSQKAKDLPNEIADSIYRLESDIYRLKRLAEKSKSYLQTDLQEGPMFNNSRFKIEDICHDLSLEYPNIEIQVEDSYFLKSDQYWFKMCVSNIIENAIRYGEPPIIVKSYVCDQYYCLDIIDSGNIKYKNMREILNAKHENTKGLGLGLIIINKTLKLLNGHLTFKQNPTTFTIRMNKEIKNG